MLVSVIMVMVMCISDDLNVIVIVFTQNCLGINRIAFVVYKF
jgi:hypothetical protein